MEHTLIQYSTAEKEEAIGIFPKSCGHEVFAHATIGILKSTRSHCKPMLRLFIPITCLRGITWCAMAWVQYQEPGRMIRNEETFCKIESYLEEGFLERIESIFSA